MEHPFKASTRGPLEEFAEGFLTELTGLGYSSCSRAGHLCLMKQVSEWLRTQGLSAAHLTDEEVAKFVAVRRQRYAHLRSIRALDPVLSYLRRQGVAPQPAPKVPIVPSEVLAERFARYLSTERGLAPSSVNAYLDKVRPFLLLHSGDAKGGSGTWSSLTAKQVDAGKEAHSGQSVALRITALRSLLRWLWVEEFLPRPLAEGIGSVATRSGNTTPKALSPSQISDLLDALPAEGVVRLRNEAMLALMWRLGLRAGEVASLHLEDIGWRAGVLAVRGKGNRRDQVPLPVDVGEVLASYLQSGRPAAVSYRQVFLAVRAPHRPLGPDGVSCLVARALAHAGITGPGAAHRLRHTAACRVLSSGGGLVEAGQLLRHASAATTAIYAKTDLTALGVLARPWPMQSASR